MQKGSGAGWMWEEIELAAGILLCPRSLSPSLPFLDSRDLAWGILTAPVDLESAGWLSWPPPMRAARNARQDSQSGPQPSHGLS